MTKEHLTAIWAVVGTALISYTLAAWIASAGGEFAKSLLIYSGPRTGELIAFFVCAALLALQLLIGIAYARRFPGATWHCRMPVFMSKTLQMENLNTESREGRIYQGFFLLIFVLIPMLALVHFWRRVGDGVVTDDHDFSRMGVWSGAPRDRIFGALRGDNSFHFGDWHATDTAGLKGLVTWFPVFEPLVMALIAAGIAILAVIYLFTLLRRGPGSPAISK